MHPTRPRRRRRRRRTRRSTGQLILCELPRRTNERDSCPGSLRPPFTHDSECQSISIFSNSTSLGLSLIKYIHTKYIHTRLRPLLLLTETLRPGRSCTPPPAGAPAAAPPPRRPGCSGRRSPARGRVGPEAKLPENHASSERWSWWCVVVVLPFIIYIHT